MRQAALVLLLLLPLASSLDVSFFQEKLNGTGLTSDQINDVAKTYNSSKKPKQAVLKWAGGLPSAQSKKVKQILQKISDVDKYLDNLFADTMKAAKKVVNQTLIKQFEAIKGSSDIAFKKNFAVAQSALVKAASKLVSADKVAPLTAALNSPLASVANKTKKMQALQSNIKYFSS